MTDAVPTLADAEIRRRNLQADADPAIAAAATAALDGGEGGRATLSKAVYWRGES